MFARMGDLKKGIEIKKNLCNHLRIVSIDRSDLVHSDFNLLMYQRNTAGQMGMRRNAAEPQAANPHPKKT